MNHINMNGAFKEKDEEMKPSGAGLMPLVVLWEWKGEESGRRRGE